MEVEFTFYYFSMGQWLAIAAFSLVSLIPAARILKRAGFSIWWAIFLVFPLVNLIALWVIAYVRWPLDRTTSATA